MEGSNLQSFQTANGVQDGAQLRNAVQQQAAPPQAWSPPPQQGQYFQPRASAQPVAKYTWGISVFTGILTGLLVFIGDIVAEKVMGVKAKGTIS